LGVKRLLRTVPSGVAGVPHDFVERFEAEPVDHWIDAESSYAHSLSTL